ncbi:NUDIX hydrolase [Candidatus Saccharibacteria bacterium]|nr:MAG: NUDIX hydrolase [Candidatus Saccharibacteria bacterium]
MIHCEFEDSSPALLRHVTVNCLVLKNGKILLGKRAAGLLESGKWGPLGGFMNRNETTAETAEREVMEESGWRIKNLRLLRINDNPNRPNEDRQNIDFVYVATAVEQTGSKDWENEEIRWFSLTALPPCEQIAFDHYENIELYKTYLEHSFSLPIVGALPSRKD